MGLAIIIKLHFCKQVPGRIWPVGCSSLSTKLHHGECLNRNINLHRFGALHMLTINQRKPIIRKKMIEEQLGALEQRRKAIRTLIDHRESLRPQLLWSESYEAIFISSTFLFMRLSFAIIC